MLYTFEKEVKNLTIIAEVDYSEVETGSGWSEFWGSRVYESCIETEINQISIQALYYNGVEIELRPLFRKIITEYLYKIENDIIFKINTNN